MTNHVARNTPTEHITSFYRDWEDVRHQRFDGFIVTGAPVETLPFEQVTYWDELRRVFDWTQTHVHSSFNICWGAQAAVHHFHFMPKYQLPRRKRSAYARHRNLAPTSPYLRGFSDDFSIPVSRWTEVRRDDIPPDSGMNVLMESDEAGLCLLDDPRRRSLHMFNHIEYDLISLSDVEYFPRCRDRPADRCPTQLLPARRSAAPAGEPLAQPRASAVRQLDQPALPDDAVRSRGDRAQGNRVKKDQGSAPGLRAGQALKPARRLCLLDLQQRRSLCNPSVLVALGVGARPKAGFGAKPRPSFSRLP